MRRFWTMAAHYHGQTWNSSAVASSLGVNDTTARRYLDVLAGAYMLRLLPPWFENLGKRQRKLPKSYFRDTGLLHSLLGLRTREAVLGHPKAGASWEGFALEQVLRTVPTRDAYYWALHGGAELDLLLFHEGRRHGFEFKLADAPTLTASMTKARDTLALDRLWVIAPTERPYELAERIQVLPLASVPSTSF
jgi:predicted AAA+ superfamily ATPase